MADLERLNAPRVTDRLAALRETAARGGHGGKAGGARAWPPPEQAEVNCHVHTFYSFSPYSPSAAAERASAAGLAAVGIMDHDSMAGTEEMHAAGAILRVATTAGVELRVSAEGTALEGRRINNPDSDGLFYMIIHGVPRGKVPAVQAFLRPLQEAREKRERRMLDRLNGLLPGYGLPLIDWNRDVRSASHAAEGGSITERHILYALARCIVDAVGRGEPLLGFLQGMLKVEPSPRVAAWLSERENPSLLFDLLGVLKSSFMEEIFIQPDRHECIPVSRVVSLAEELGGIPTYAYLGDVADSPTGDKRAERFEDSYLDELMQEARRLGFRAIAYMPPRNTVTQLRRVQKLCAEHGFMEISGVDINSPRQSFNCPELLQPDFSHLLGATWALVAHENLSDQDPCFGLFHRDNPLAAAPLSERIARYARVGRGLDPSDRQSGADLPLVRSLLHR
jgi:hypothetical protein